MYDANAVADYLTQKLILAGSLDVSVLKLHKLLYYSHAWFLARDKKPLLPSEFEAWVHGPAYRPVFDRYKGTKTMYDSIHEGDLLHLNAASGLPVEVREHLDEILALYGKYSGSQLEELSHSEEPWIRARAGLGPLERGNEPIRNEWLIEFFSKRLATD